MATAPKYSGQVYRDKKKRWRWRVVAPNGNIVADCSEGDGYRRPGEAEQMLRTVTGLGRRLRVERVV